MDYIKIEQVFQSELPINRKERFYTGTILPALLFHKGLSNLYCFLGEIPGFPCEINEENTKDEFLFYTEYNLKESAVKNGIGTEIFTDTRDTPDLLIEILKPIKVFVIIEAKMFASPTQNDLNKQMREQRMAVVDILKQKYPESRVFHIALIPEKLGLKSTPDYTVANWEFLIENDNLDIQDNYFYPYLKFALANYTRLCSKKWGKASTIRLELPGSKIYEDGKAGKTLWVGRWGGRKTVEADVAKGIWKHKLYGTNTEQPKGGQEGNWIKSSEFAEIVDHS